MCLYRVCCESGRRSAQSFCYACLKYSSHFGHVVKRPCMKPRSGNRLSPSKFDVLWLLFAIQESKTKCRSVIELKEFEALCWDLCFVFIIQFFKKYARTRISNTFDGRFIQIVAIKTPIFRVDFALQRIESVQYFTHRSDV